MITGIDDIANLLRSVPGIRAVFNDGRLLNDMGEDRRVSQVPYIELQRAEVDATEQRSTRVNEECRVIGRLVLMKKRDAFDQWLNALLAAFATREPYYPKFRIDQNFSPRLFAIEMDIRYLIPRSKS